MRPYWGLAAVFVLVFAGGGCGARSTTVTLEGNVTYDGHAIEQGRIEFIPIDGTSGPSAGATIASGHYALPDKCGLLADGVYQVHITALRKTGRKQPNRIDRGAPPVEITENFIPPMFNSQSTLKLRVADLADRNKADFHLGT